MVTGKPITRLLTSRLPLQYNLHLYLSADRTHDGEGEVGELGAELAVADVVGREHLCRGEVLRRFVDSIDNKWSLQIIMRSPAYGRGRRFLPISQDGNGFF